MSDLRTAAQQALEALEWISDCYVGDDDDAGECASCHERSYKPHAPDCKKNNAITALRAALEQQAEPIDTDCHAQGICQRSGYGIGQQAEPVEEPAYKVKVAGRWHEAEPLAAAFNLPDGEHLLYTAPPQRKQAEPAQEPITRLFGTLPVHDTQQALAQQAEPVEPGAWVASKDGRVIYDDASTDDGLLRVSGDFKNDEQRVRYAQRIVDKLNAALAQQAEPVEPVAWAFRHSDGTYHDPSVTEHSAGMAPLYTAPPQRKPLPKHDQHCVDVPGYGLMAVRLVRAVERAHGIKE